MAKDNEGNAAADPIEALAAELVDDLSENDPAKVRLSREEQIARVAESIRQVAAATAAPAERRTADQKIQNIVDAAAAWLSREEKIADAAAAETERGRRERRQ